MLHSHSACCNIVTSLFEGQTEFTISHQEMIKGIAGYGYFDTLRIPIIENTAWEHELADSLGEAIANNPRACAVLVRRHGMYVWGNTWEEAKRHGECLHYLFDIAIRMKQLGMDFNAPPRPLPSAAGGTSNGYKHVLLDIEGTTTPITFVHDTLFPYAAANVGAFLLSNWSSGTVSAIVAQLQQQALDDLTGEAAISSAAATAFAQSDLQAADTSLCISAATEYAIALIKADRKVGPLKALQGLIWEQAYKKGSIHGAVFEDFPAALQRWTKAGTKVSIYSSGSRHAQQLLFGHSVHGDLRPHLNAYFDTAVGPKQAAASYRDILLSLGVPTEEAGSVLFLTDILGEARAASEAGLSTMLSLRTGNAPITEEHAFKSFSSFEDL